MDRKGAALTIALFCCFACGSQGDQEGVDIDGKADVPRLVGGHEAEPNELPSAILIVGGCTAAVVSPVHILTAAHCVSSASGLRYNPGDTIRITNWRGETSAASPEGAHEATVASVHVHDSYSHAMTACLSLGDCPVSSRGAPVVILSSQQTGIVAADVAIIRLERVLSGDDFPPATIDVRPVEVGDELIVGGYGCEEDPSTADRTTLRYKIQETQSIDRTYAVHSGSYLSPLSGDELYEFGQSYLFTPGIAMDGQEASLCPGDSGGPVYRRGSGDTTIVGVNAYYSFVSGQAVAYTNWHTRTAAFAHGSPSNESVAAWLQDLGVPLTETEPPPLEVVEATHLSYDYQDIVTATPAVLLSRYEADDPELLHMIGAPRVYESQIEWSASTNRYEHGGYLSMGPYATFSDGGQYATARFELRCNEATFEEATEAPIFTVDVFDATTETLLAERFVTGPQLGAAPLVDEHYGAIDLEFLIPEEDHNLELRVLWAGGSWMPEKICALRAIEVFRFDNGGL